MVGFSWVLTRYYEDRADRETLPTVVTILGLSIVLASVTLVPVDIFILSSTINPATGKPQEWATPELIAQQEQIVTILYYGTGPILRRARAASGARGQTPDRAAPVLGRGWRPPGHSVLRRHDAVHVHHHPVRLLLL